MTATFGTDLVDKTKQAKSDACRARLQSAGRAAQQLETDVRWLVKERAWDVLGYKDFAEMWESECGFKCPPIAKVMAADSLMEEGVRTPDGEGPADGHTFSDIARSVGYKPAHRDADTNTVKSLYLQREHGVPMGDRKAGGQTARVIAEHGTRPYLNARQRPTPKRRGAHPDEYVSEGFSLIRRDADAIEQIARQADVPKSEIYRQAVAEYLARYRESRPEVAP